MPRPDVDRVSGVPPSIALEQRTTRAGAKSTVATVTEVALRLLAEYAPQRPVRLLGVRVAGLISAGEPGQPAASRGADGAHTPAAAQARDPGQLALPV